MKSGRIIAHDNMYFSNSTITKQSARSLRLKLCKLLSYAAEFQEMRKSIFTAARGLLDLAKALKKLNCFDSDNRREFIATV